MFTVAPGATRQRPSSRWTDSAAEKTAHAEDTAIFNGFKAGGIEGIIPSSPHPAITIPDDYRD